MLLPLLALALPLGAVATLGDTTAVTVIPDSASWWYLDTFVCTSSVSPSGWPGARSASDAWAQGNAPFGFGDVTPTTSLYQVLVPQNRESAWLH